MNALENIGDEFAQFNRFLAQIIDPRECENDTMQGMVKEAIIQAYSNGYHDGQQAMADRLPKPTYNGGDEGGREYYESL